MNRREDPQDRHGEPAGATEPGEPAEGADPGEPAERADPGEAAEATSPDPASSDAEPAGGDPDPGPNDQVLETRPRAPAGLREPAHAFPVAGIGCSAGGLAPLRELLSGFEPDCGIAFVVIQHLDPSSESHMTMLLERVTRLPVVTIEDGMEIQPGRVHVLPPNYYVTLRDHDLRLVQPRLSRGRRMPIDHFLHSLAEVQQERGLSILLSGTGDDGSSGARAVREHGGLVVVQDPEQAEYGDLPAAAIATGMVDYILPVDGMAPTILGYVRGSRLRAPAPPRIDDREMNSILGSVLARTRYDFRGYKRSTLVRRVQRRMGLNQIDDPGQYLEFLRRSEREADLLRNDLLIGVTGFFREPDSWDELRRVALQNLVAGASDDAVLRAWVPGCSTGEEAYTLSMLLLEEMAARDRVLPLQIFASDIDEMALQTARAGLYGADVVADVPDGLREKYFEAENGGFRCIKRLREPVIFSLQNLIADPPFSRLDLVSCRNVLIYLESPVQRRIVSSLAFGLRPGGCLFLGKSDSIGETDELFRPISKRHRIYRRLATGRPDVTDVSLQRAPGNAHGAMADRPQAQRQRLLADLNDEVLLRHFGACVLLVDERGKILHFSGNSTRFLDLPAGEPDLDLLKMARDRLSLKLRPVLSRVLAGKRSATIDRVRIEADGSAFTARATLEPLKRTGLQGEILAVILEEVSDPAPRPEVEDGEDDDVVRAQEDEIRRLKEELHATYEEFETSNEELKAANEEVMSMNEELQSANEELETSKEELQSINEELTTVNSQLNEKILDLGNAHSDLVNLFNATQVATIFLDLDLKIKRFTPRATEMFNLLDRDVGRPLEHISQTFARPDLPDDARRVLAKLVPIEEEIRTPQGDWFILRVFPYRTIDNRIDGVVITFGDVTRLKLAEKALEGVMGLVERPLALLDRQLQIVAASPAFAREMGVRPEQVRGQPFSRLEPNLWDQIAEPLQGTSAETGARRGLAVELGSSKGGERQRRLVDIIPMEGGGWVLHLRSERQS